MAAASATFAKAVKPAAASARSGRSRSALRIGPANDAFEREADRIADAVARSESSTADGNGFNIAGGAPPLLRRCGCQHEGAGAGTCETCADETLQRKATGASPAVVAPPLVHDVIDRPGVALDARTRQGMETRLGRSFNDVRVHTDAQAAESARQVGGLAYTVGSHIVFGAGRYAPGTENGDRLIAHELVHTVQQAGQEVRLQRACFVDECDEPASATPARATPAATATATSPEAALGPDWRNVNELGIAYKEGTSEQGGGARLTATPGGDLLEWMPQNTKMFVLKEHSTQGAYAVTPLGRTHSFGYASKSHIWLNLPDPEARIVKVQRGDTSLGLVRRHYAGEFKDAWYADQRYAVNALYWANAHQKPKGKSSSPAIEKKDTFVWRDFGVLKYRQLVKADSDDAPWETVQVNAGRYLWLPGVEYLRSLYQVVRAKGGGTGSIKAEVLQTVKGVYNKVAYGIGFAAGVIHGFFSSIWDAIAGIADLLYSVFKSVVSRDFVDDVKELARGIQQMFSEEGRKAIGESIGQWAAKWDAKLNDDSPWVRGHAHGYLTGYVMAEAAMLLLTFGGTAALKGALWGSRLGQIVKGSKAVRTLENLIAKAATVARATDARFAAAAETLKANRYAGAAIKTAEVTAQVVKWTAKGVATALNLPIKMLSHLTDAVIDRLKQLQDLFPRIKALSDRAKWWLFECHSPCRVDVRKIRRTFRNLSDDEIEAAVKVLDPATLGPRKGSRAKLTAAAGDVPPLEAREVVDAAMARLKAKRVSGLRPSEYGTKLHSELSAVLDEVYGTVPKGWKVGSETQLSNLVKLKPEVADLTVRQYMRRAGLTKQYPKLPKKFLDTKVGNLKPDLYVRAPDGRTLVWDLTSQPDPVHLAKGMFYSEVIGRETGGFLRIVEDYWRKGFR